MGTDTGTCKGTSVGYRYKYLVQVQVLVQMHLYNECIDVSKIFVQGMNYYYYYHYKNRLQYIFAF